MANISVRAADDAVSGIYALKDSLTNDLDDVLQRIEELKHSCAAPEFVRQEIVIYETARTALLSALASINEVLSWVRLAAVKDSEGNELPCVRSLPQVIVQRVH